MSTFGIVHTVLSFLALGSGAVVVAHLLSGRDRPAWTAFYLVSAVATSATGLAFPGFGVPHAIGIVSLVVLAVAILARYAVGLAGVWRAVYAIAAVFGLYGLAFFTVGEAFLRIRILQAAAPTLTELPFWSAQAGVLAAFIGLAVRATRSFGHRAKSEAPH
jgi:hypothetical protein